MTLEKLRKFIYDIFSYETEGESSELYTEAFNLLESSMIIPKPKFQVGDRVTDKDEYPYWVNECFYDLLKNEWWYVSRHGERVYESELELVEMTQDGNG